MNMQCFMVGHSNYQMDYFINLLKSFKIDVVVDIRAVAYCNYAKWFDRENIEFEIKENSIKYIFMGDLLGARYFDEDMLLDNGRVNFLEIQKLSCYKEGFKRVVNGVKKRFRVAIMCAEKEPFDCHRTFLLSRDLQKEKIEPIHILEDGSFLTQRDIEKRLLSFYDLKKTLFDFDIDEALLIEKAYRLRNYDIGYLAKK